MTTPTPYRLPRPGAAWTRLLGLLRALTCALTLTVLLAALPWLLAHYLGHALPGHIPSPGAWWDAAQRPVDITAVEAVLAAAGWASWAVLAALTAYELAWQAVHLPRLLRAADLSALTARRTLAGFLIAGIVLGLAALLRPATATARTTSAAPALAPAAATAPANPAPAPAATSSAYTVRDGDTLWALAERHLHDPERWPEIYQLNKDQPQSDGRRLADPDLIYPGWQLRLPPEHATPPPAAAPQPPSPPAPAPTPTPAAPTTPAPTAAPTSEPATAPTPTRAPSPMPSTPTASATPAAIDNPQQHAGTRPAGTHLPRGAGYIPDALIVALAAAAATLILRRRRTQQPTLTQPPDQQLPLRPEHQPLITAVRGIHRARTHEHGTTLPTGPAGTPVGETATRPVSVADLAAAVGSPALALTGPGAAAALRALVVTAAATTPHPLAITRPLLRHLLPATDGAPPPGLTLATDADHLLALAEEHVLRQARYHEQPDPTQRPTPLLVLSDAVDPRYHPRWNALLLNAQRAGLHAFFLATPPAGAPTLHVDEDGTTRPVQTEAARALHHLDPTRLFHLKTQPASTFLRVVREAKATDPPPTAEPETDPEPAAEPVAGEAAGVPQQQPAPAAPDAPRESPQSRPEPEDKQTPQPPPATPGHDEPPVAARTFGDDRARLTAAAPTAPATATTDGPQSAPATPARITLLGRMAVHVHGAPCDRAARGVIGALLTYLALHPDGATGEEIMEALWPDRDPATKGAQAFAAAKNKTRAALRTALGGTAAALILSTGDSVWRLDPHLISSDLAAFQQAVHRAKTTHDPAQRAAACEEAAALYTGELCTGSDHPWLDAPRELARTQVLAALTELANATDDTDRALAYLDRALVHDPYNEQLHLRLARLHASRGSSEAVRRIHDRLTKALTEIDARPTPGVARAFADLLNPLNPPPTPMRRPAAGRQPVRP